MKNILLLVLLFIKPYDSLAALSCSANGLKVLYINGVNVQEKGNVKTADNISVATKPIQSQLDNNNVFPVIGVWNTSSKLLNDIEELKVQLAVNHQGKKRVDYWKALARESFRNVDFAFKDKINEALEQITSKKKYIFNKDGSVSDQDSFTSTDLYNDLAKLNSDIAPLLANAASDIAVVEELKLRIKTAYSAGANKLIVVAHSQGNEVLYSAVNELRLDRSFLKTDADIKTFDSLVGYLQIAPPSPRLVTASDSYFNLYPDHAQVTQLLSWERI